MNFFVTGILIYLCSLLNSVEHTQIIIGGLYLSLATLYFCSSYFSNVLKRYFKFLSIIPLLMSTPILENDFNRYFIEAFYFFKGVDIYNIMPISYFTFNHKLLAFYKNFGFPNIPSIYGPLTHLFHGFFVYLFPTEWILGALKTFYWLTLIVFYHRIKIISYLLVVFLWSEFANSVHIDALVIVFFLLGMSFIDEKSKLKSSFFFLLSALTKATAILYLPFIIIAFYKHKKPTTFIFIILLALIFSFYLRLISIEMFLSEWVWNPGFIKWLPLSFKHYGFVFVLLSFSLFLILDQGFRKKHLYHILGVVSLGHLLLSFTINGWYLIYPLVFFNLSDRRAAVNILLCLWPLCYAPWSNQHYFVIISNTFFHLIAWCLFFGECYCLNSKLRGKCSPIA